MPRNIETAKRTTKLPIQSSSGPKRSRILWSANQIKNSNTGKSLATLKEGQAVFW